MAAELILKTNQFQHVGDPIPDLLFPGTHHPHGEGHIFIDRHFINEAVVLEHGAHRAAQIRDLPPANPLQRVAVDVDRAGGGLQLTGNELDDRGLARAGGAHQKAEFSIFNLHGHAV